MKTRWTIGCSIRGAVLLLALAAGAATFGRAEPNDYEACTAQQYDRLRTASEIAATIGACSRVLQLPSVTAPQRGARCISAP